MLTIGFPCREYTTFERIIRISLTFNYKISLLDMLGTITGGMTSTPGLAAVDSMTDSNIPGVAYATVYPIAMVFLILFIQFIAAMVV